MDSSVTSIRPFIGARDFGVSRGFYRDIGFQEHSIDVKLSIFKMGATAFYLQDYYSREWIDNTMVFMEVNSAVDFYSRLLALNLTEKYNGARLLPVRHLDWGSECYLHDPSGVLWHIGEFNK